MSYQVSLFIFAPKIALWSYLWQITAISAHVIGD